MFLRSVPSGRMFGLIFCSMGHGNLIVFALTDLFLKICSKGFVPEADIFCRIKQGISQLMGTAFSHMGLCRIQLPRLISRGRQSGKGEDLVGIVGLGEIPDFRQDHSSHAVTDTGDACNGRLALFHDRLDGSFNLVDLICHHLYQMGGVLQFHGFGRKDGADGASGSIPDCKRHIAFITAFGSGF